jgi:hypothetical protein
MKKIINSEIFGSSLISLMVFGVIFSCFYLKANNINPRHAITKMIVNEVA